MKKLLLALLFLSFVRSTVAQEIDTMKMIADTLEASFRYQHGKIELENKIGTLDVPTGFRYLDAQQAEYVIRDLWGNPDGSGTLGMIVPEDIGVSEPNSWAFILTYDEMGYVKDDDAGDIDYDELLTEMQHDTQTANEERSKLGYDTITLVGWASKPYYDNDKKVLHWAKELKFGEGEDNTLNYNIRVLGRKGVLVLNAVSSMEQFTEVQKNIDPVLASFQYADGNKYGDFNPDIDEVAAWTIGGLVAGKMLAKVGFFAIFLKYIKFIGIALLALGSAAWRWFKKKTEPPTVRNISDSTQA